MLRHTFRFEEYMTMPILDKTARLTFAIAMVWTYLNLIEYSTVWYGADSVAKETLLQRATGPYAPYWWLMNFLGSVVPFALIFKRLRANLTAMMIVSLLLNLGMWLERWMIVTPTFSHGYYPWTWNHTFFPSWVQWGVVFGSFGWFGMLFMLFCKLVLSLIHISEPTRPY